MPTFLSLPRELRDTIYNTIITTTITSYTKDEYLSNPKVLAEPKFFLTCRQVRTESAGPYYRALKAIIDRIAASNRNAPKSWAALIRQQRPTTQASKQQLPTTQASNLIEKLEMFSAWARRRSGAQEDDGEKSDREAEDSEYEEDEAEDSEYEESDDEVDSVESGEVEDS